MVGGEYFCFGLAENIGVLVVFFQNRGEIDFLGDSGGFGLYCEAKLEGKHFQA